MTPVLDVGHEPQRIDFRRPPAVAKERLRALEVMHDRFVKSLEGWLITRTRGDLELHLSSVKQIPYSEFLRTLESPCCAFLANIKDCGGRQGVIDIGLELSYFLVDRLFGGSGDATILDRALTPIERMALRVAAERVLVGLQESWQERVPLEMELDGFESVPEILQSTGTDDAVLSVEIIASFMGRQDRIAISLPLMALEAFFASTSSNGRKPIGVSVGSEQEIVANRNKAEAQLRATHVALRACLPEFRITLRDLSQLQTGSVLRTGIASTSPILGKIGSTTRFRCAAGRVGGKMAIRVQESLDAPDSGANSTTSE
jgi:flagellar motor switch protein FliM